MATSLSASVILHFAYYYSVQALLTLSPMSFTIGEAVTVAQAISVFCLSTWLNLIQHVSVDNVELTHTWS